MAEPPRRALLLGNSDGIGKAFANRLLSAGWQVTGFSRSAITPPEGTDTASLQHHTGSVADPDFRSQLAAIHAARGPFELCAFCVGIAGDGGPMDFAESEQVVRTNFNAVLHTLDVVIPGMQQLPPDPKGVRGHFIGLSSMADALRVADAGAYTSSKAGMSNYLTSLGLHLRPQGIRVTNVRFGFVDTKMARAPVRPFMVGTDRAARVLMGCVRRRPLQCSHPWPMAWLVRLLQSLQALRVGLLSWFG